MGILPTPLTHSRHALLHTFATGLGHYSDDDGHGSDDDVGGDVTDGRFMNLSCW